LRIEATELIDELGLFDDFLLSDSTLARFLLEGSSPSIWCVWSFLSGLPSLFLGDVFLDQLFP